MLKILSALALVWAAVAAPGADAPATFKVGEFTFTRPAKWEWSAKPFGGAKARLRLISSEKGKNADVQFFDKGMTINRESRPMTEYQFTSMVTNNFFPPYPRVETNLAGHKLTFVNTRPASEAAKLRPPAAPQPGMKTVLAFMESKKGNVWIVFSGTKELVEASEAEFRKMIETAAAGK